MIVGRCRKNLKAEGRVLIGLTDLYCVPTNLKTFHFFIMSTQLIACLSTYGFMKTAVVCVNDEFQTHRQSFGVFGEKLHIGLISVLTALISDRSTKTSAPVSRYYNNY